MLGEKMSPKNNREMPWCTPNVWTFFVNVHFSLYLDILEVADCNR